MRNDFEKIVRDRFDRLDQSGPDKVLPLDEAVRRAVRPGISLHTGITHVFAYAAIDEINRQYWGKAPGFTLIVLGGRVHGVVMIHGKLLKRIVSTFNGDVYPSPGPNPVFQKAYLEKSVEFENWSVLTLPLRLRAAAQGVSCEVTRSLIGSGMESDNRESFQVVDDPFEPSAKIGLLKALRPDVSVVHGVAADAQGNTLFTPPYGEALWGAMAAREGALVTVEKIVSTDFIRRHAHFAKLPGCFVRSVSEVPFGAHPGGLHVHGIEGIESYAEDYDFVEEFRNATREEKKLDAWIHQWILDCPDRSEYTRRLGYPKMMYLKGKSSEESWRKEIDIRLDKLDAAPQWNPMERMVVIAARRLADRVRRNGYTTILAGIGASNLAAWIAASELKREGVDIELVAEIGFYGYSPRPADPFIFNHANIPTCKVVTDIFEALGTVACGGANNCIGALGAAQVDRFGNINSTMIPGKMYLTGSGGANDVMSASRDVMLVVPQAKNRFVEKVPYITGVGARATVVVSTLGVFEKLDGANTFTLTACFTDDALPTKEACVEEIARRCGWHLQVADVLGVEPPPTADELRLLRLFDPDRHFTEANEAR